MIKLAIGMLVVALLIWGAQAYLDRLVERDER